MLDELLKHNKLGNKEELLFLLFNGLSTDGHYSVESIKKYCISNLFSISRNFEGLLSLCKFISFVQITDDKISLNNGHFKQTEYERTTYLEQFHFYLHLINALKNANALQDIFTPDNIKFSQQLSQYYIVESKFPYRFFPLRNILISTGFFYKHENWVNHLIIKREFTQDFKNYVIDEIFVQHKNKQKSSLSQLKKNQQAKEEAGRRAEEFALQYEHSRLQGHVTAGLIKLISDEYVNAGYDIQSFEGYDSIFIDRFIEVKSYANEVSFFWSKNEIETAKELKSKYFLYLIDRSRINEENYKPQQIQDPYKKIFESDIWNKETENWKITLEE